MIELVDTHVHFHFPDYDSDRDEVIHHAQEAGVRYFVNVGTNLETSEKSLELAKRRPEFFATAGVHPHDAKDASEDELKAIRKLIDEKRMVAIGEVGLDFFRNLSPEDIQIKIFERFLQMHVDTGKPLVIHCRDAYAKMAEVLKHFRQGAFQGVMHCFSSDKETMFRFLDLGFHISFAGPLTYKKNDVLREACRTCPKESLLLETDAPFLPPESFRGKRNESSYLVHTAEMAAKTRVVPLEELCEQTTRNAIRLFGLC
ncbi:MAG: TatD family deoxyribonuclease [Candidatus Omnitrophica bacterium]|nr:TatD family deoxyribonuclease [Candidatus Omnitrophota bacterium]